MAAGMVVESSTAPMVMASFRAFERSMAWEAAAFEGDGVLPCRRGVRSFLLARGVEAFVVGNGHGVSYMRGSIREEVLVQEVGDGARRGSAALVPKGVGQVYCAAEQSP